MRTDLADRIVQSQLEINLEAKLETPGVARREHLAEIGVAEANAETSPVGVVERIEALDAELGGAAFLETEILEHGEVPNVGAGSDDGGRGSVTGSRLSVRYRLRLALPGK